jgi:hypothetical protein
MAEFNKDVTMEQLPMDNCKNIGRPPPTKKHVMPDGTIREEKLNPMPCHKKMSDGNGHVFQVSLATGFTIRGLGTHNPYGVEKLREKLAAGWLPYDQCPVKEGYMPADGKSDKPCEGTFSREKCCPHIEKAITARRTAYEKKQKAYARKASSNQERMLEILEKQTEELAGKAAKGDEAAKAFR